MITPPDRTHSIPYLYIKCTKQNISFNDEMILLAYLQFNPTFQESDHVSLRRGYKVRYVLTICSVVRSNSLGPKMAGAKNLRKMKPEITEYLTSLLSRKKKKAEESHILSTKTNCSISHNNVY
jgi:hypothetical protein